MPDVVEWRTDDAPALLDRIGRHLREGRLVALPTEAGYEAIASALHPAAVTELAAWPGPGEPPAIVLASALEAFDWLPQMRGVGVRLPRAFWPGPLTLVCNAGANLGLARHLPPAVQRCVLHRNHLALRAPDHDWPGPLRRRLAQPLVAAPLPGFPQEVAYIQGGRDQLALIVDAGPSAFIKPPTRVRIDAAGVMVLRPGAVPAADLDDATPCHILFVCTGNTCRSPLAEALCRALLSAKVGCGMADLPRRGFCVQSAGLAAAPDNPATLEALTVARAYGADLGQHRSQLLSFDLLARADRVFTMTWSHLNLLHSLRVPVGPAPQLLAPAGADIDDPIGGDDAVYRACADQIWHCLIERLPELQEL